MRKILTSVAFAMAVIFAGSAYAQNDSVQVSQQQSQTISKETKKGEKKGEKKGKKNLKGKKDWKGDKDKKGGEKGQRINKEPKFNPFEGIQLTPEQQQRLQVLREGLGPVKLDKAQQEKVYGKDSQKQKKENLTPEQRIQMKEQKKQAKAERNAKKIETKKKYLSGVKEILSPDQYVMFLENVYINRK